jgi:hypothetical protein
VLLRVRDDRRRGRRARDVVVAIVALVRVLRGGDRARRPGGRRGPILLLIRADGDDAER